MGVHNIAANIQKPLNDVRGILDKIHVDPQDPLLIPEGVEKQIIAGPGQNAAAKRRTRRGDHPP